MERNGVAGTSVDQILEAAQTSKGAFFHHFDSKRELTAVLMERYVEADLGHLRAGLAAVETIADPVERALGFARHFEGWAEKLVDEDSACLYIAALSEQDLVDGAVHDAVLRAITTWRIEVAALLAPALAARAEHLVEVPDAHELADHLFATFEGGYLLCRSLGSPEPMRAQLRVFRQLLESLFADRAQRRGCQQVSPFTPARGRASPAS
jgi:TetR/AcrR family transcriptional regulator, transcriptional repressor for nem operon